MASNVTPLTIGLVGTGNSGKNIAQAMAGVDEIALQGVCSGHLANARALADKYHIDFACDALEDLLARDVEAVCISVPHGLHYPLTMQALEAGKHVLLEKPMAINLHQVDAMIEAARAADRKLGVFFQKRFSETTRKMRALVQEELGHVFHADVYVKWFRDAAYYADSAWRGRWETEGGGPVMNQASHPIDLLVWMLGPITSVMAHTQTVGHDIEVEDAACALVRFESGVTATITATTAIVPGFPAEIAVHGTEGTVRLVGDDLYFYQPGDAPDKPPLAGASHNNFSDPTTFAVGEHQALLRDFVAAVREDRPPLVSGAEGRKAVEIIRAIYKSGQDHALVQVPFED